LDTKALSDFIVKHSVHQRTLDGFWIYIKNWKLEDPEDFETNWKDADFGLLKIVLKKVSLTINYRFDAPIEYVQAYASIIRDDEEIAVYHSLFNLDGTDNDDVLSFTVFD
jgi:hypothetical protein